MKIDKVFFAGFAMIGVAIAYVLGMYSTMFILLPFARLGQTFTWIDFMRYWILNGVFLFMITMAFSSHFWLIGKKKEKGKEK